MNTKKKSHTKKRAVTLRRHHHHVEETSGGAQGASVLSHISSTAQTLLLYKWISGPIANRPVIQPLFKFKNLYTVRNVNGSKRVEFFETNPNVWMTSEIAFYFANNVCEKCKEFSTELNKLMSTPDMKKRLNVIYVPINSDKDNMDYYINNLSNIFMLNIKMDRRMLNKILNWYAKSTGYNLPYMVIHDISDDKEKKYIDCSLKSVRSSIAILKTYVLYGPNAPVQDVPDEPVSKEASTMKDCGLAGPCLGGSSLMMGGGGEDVSGAKPMNMAGTYVASFLRKSDGSISKRMTFKDGKLLYADRDISGIWMNNDDLATITRKLSPVQPDIRQTSEDVPGEEKNTRARAANSIG